MRKTEGEAREKRRREGETETGRETLRFKERNAGGRTILLIQTDHIQDYIKH